MSSSVICPSCGHRQQLPRGFDRRKVRCPECGVMCPVEDAPARAKRAGPKQESEEDAAARLLGEVEAPASAPRRQPALPPAPKKGAAPSPPPAPEPERDSEDDDDGKPYIVEGPEERKCPECSRIIAADASVCVACGFDLRKGKKLKRTYAPLERSWDLGIQLPQRKKLFVALMALGMVLGGGMAALKENWTGFIVPWLVFTAMLSFLLGTFFHADLSRDKKGRVRLTRTWRICFIPRAPCDIDVMQYSGVRAGVSRDAGMFEWLICADLLLPLIVPGVLFWYHVIHKDRHYVELTREHGYSDQIIYRGNDAALAQEVTAALRDAGGLREETA